MVSFERLEQRTLHISHPTYDDSGKSALREFIPSDHIHDQVTVLSQANNSPGDAKNWFDAVLDFFKSPLKSLELNESPNKVPKYDMVMNLKLEKVCQQLKKGIDLPELDRVQKTFEKKSESEDPKISEKFKKRIEKIESLKLLAVHLRAQIFILLSAIVEPEDAVSAIEELDKDTDFPDSIKSDKDFIQGDYLKDEVKQIKKSLMAENKRAKRDQLLSEKRLAIYNKAKNVHLRILNLAFGKQSDEFKKISIVLKLQHQYVIGYEQAQSEDCVYYIDSERMEEDEFLIDLISDNFKGALEFSEGNLLGSTQIQDVKKLFQKDFNLFLNDSDSFTQITAYMKESQANDFDLKVKTAVKNERFKFLLDTQKQSLEALFSSLVDALKNEGPEKKDECFKLRMSILEILYPNKIKAVSPDLVTAWTKDDLNKLYRLIMQGVDSKLVTQLELTED